eukprot:392996_1
MKTLNCQTSSMSTQHTLDKKITNKRKRKLDEIFEDDTQDTSTSNHNIESSSKRQKISNNNNKNSNDTNQSNKLIIASYNVFGDGIQIEQRKEHIYKSLMQSNCNESQSIPDVICLQEASSTLIKYLLSTEYFKQYQIFEKPQSNKTTEAKCYLTVLSRFEFIKKELIYEGNYFDDGIMRIVLNTKEYFGENVIIYHVHCIGGSYNKTKEIIKQNSMKRINELKIVNKYIETDMNNDLTCKDSDLILILGDFNCDANDNNIDEYEHFVNNKYKNVFYDTWELLHPDIEGNTESTTL